MCLGEDQTKLVHLTPTNPHPNPPLALRIPPDRAREAIEALGLLLFARI